MSGHHKKGIVDAKRAKIFTRMSKLISVAVKEANGDTTHPSVLAAVEKAKKYDVPKENIERAIKKGSDKDSAVMEVMTYEGYGPGGVGLIIEAVTDNKNRTAQEVKHAFSKLDFAMGVPGSVSWGFTKDQEGEWTPNAGTEIELSEQHEEKLKELIAALEELDDVTNVHTNAL